MGLVMKCLCCGASTILIAGNSPQIVEGECLSCYEEYQGDYTKHPHHKEEVWKKKKSDGVPTTNATPSTSRRK